LLQFSSVEVRDNPSGLRAFVEVLLEPSGRDVWLGTAGTLEAAKNNEQEWLNSSFCPAARHPDRHFNALAVRQLKDVF